MKAIYEFYWDCGRMGNVTGTFVAKKKMLRNLSVKQFTLVKF